MKPSSPFTLKQRLLLALGAPLLAWAVRVLAWTWRTRVIAPPATQPSESTEARVYGVWHDGLVAITGRWRDHAIRGLASQSFDGELVSRVMEHLGYLPLARGSSSRGGAQGLAAQIEALIAGHHVSITMDGPRGPRHQCKPGAAIMAARSGRPLAPLVCAARPALRLKNWDRTLVPWPFAKVVFVFGEPIRVPAEGGEAVSASLPEQMERLQAQAEEALSGF